MTLSVHNSTFWQILWVSLLIAIFSLSIFSQETQPTLETVLAMNDPAARLEALQKFLQTQPDAQQAETARAELTRVYAYLGETQLAAKTVDEAIQSFKQAIAAFPKQVDDKFFEEVAARIPLAVSIRGYRTEAILLAREMEARFGTEAIRLASIGEFYLSVEAPTEALRALNSAAKLTPDNARIYRLLGAAHRVNLNLDRAAEQYTAAIKADPNDSRAYFELANLQRARGRYEVATNLYNKQLSLEPEHAPSLKGLALCHFAQGQDERANELLAQATRITNTDLTRDFYLQTQLALTYLARGNGTKARQATDAAIAAEPRFSWARIAAAEVELAEGKYFEAERNIIAAMKYADFPTLHFTLGKIYLAVEDFEGALNEFGKAFSYKAGKFQTRLGGVQEVSAETVAELLAPERQASMFQAEAITSEVEFKLAENLARFEAALRGPKQSSSQLLSSILLSQKNNKAASVELEKSAEDFIETEGSRKPFRWLYAAERLTQSGQSLETVLKLTDQAMEAAESATASEGSLRDYPNYDRDGRLRVFRGRALVLRGRALIKLNRSEEAIKTLEQAVESYGSIPERNRAQWQLALAKESAGQTKDALDLYIVAYEPPDKNSVGSDLNRTVIEALYRKIHGSLDGLNDRIGKTRETALATNTAPITPPTPPIKTEVKPVETTTTTPPVVSEGTSKPEVAAEKITAEVTVAEIKSEVKPEAGAAAVSPVILPEAALVTWAIAELGPMAPAQELILTSEDALPPSLIVATNSSKPVEESAATASPILLPEVKPISLALVAEELAQTEPPSALSLDVEDAPLPSKTTETASTATVKIEEEKSSSVSAPIILPETIVIRNLLVSSLEEMPRYLPEQMLSFLETEDSAPPAASATTAARSNATTEPLVTAQETTLPKTATTTELSDARVAEIEKAIGGGAVVSGAIVGKKGNATAATEEAASGHLEGDVPLRISKTPDPGLPTDESGRVIPTTPKVTAPGTAEGLPVEVELRAKAMGQSAGKLSAGAALEVEAEKPAGQGRKGTRNADDVEEDKDKNKDKITVRPRRVKEDESTPKPRNQ
ncbi:MAG: tetratricopeptide repeat protein [Blastocatellia bacterium]|nr:tetratricopeptide repeat protein [Blastocatellia bacterium]